MLKMLTFKLHGIRATDANLNYRGSISLDPELCRQAGIVPFEFVDIWNKANGARISTYVILGEPGSRCCILNGSAARHCEIGDELIIAGSELVARDKLRDHEARILIFGPENEVEEMLSERIDPAYLTR
mgnify:CR=1 FL=1